MYTMNDHPFKVGDKVVVVRRVEREDGWKNVWAIEMGSYLGSRKEYRIESIDATGIRFDYYGWPAGALDFSYETKIIDTID